ncbi:MAG TPA: UvrD-helicase domain-containing protein [Desulfuromonadaceae bacterium]
MQWSEAKQEVFAFASNIVVSAGAGSGKTAALVELYLRLLAGETSLERALEVEEIVAITFTDKAATEMRERVRKGVLERLAGGDDRQLWERHRRALPGAGISTFHAFCSRILRENPAEAMVDPSFALMDETTAGAELMSALDEVMEGELHAKSADLRLLLGNFPLSGRGHGKGLREYLITLHWQCSVGGVRDTDQLRLAALWEGQARRRFAEETSRFEELSAEVRRVLAGKPLQFHEKLRPLPGLCAEPWPEPEDAGTPARVAALQECIVGNWGKQGKPLKDALVNCLETLELCSAEVRSAPLKAALIRLAGKVAAAYRLRKERRGLLDFDDLQTKTRDLLERDPELRALYRRRFAVVMVDEFQDTNPLQKDLVGLLCGPDQRLFIVGDPKQSIYLFRGADVTVFARAQQETAAAGGRNLFFQESFRSRQGVIDVVNRFFSRVMRENAAAFEVEYRPEDHLDPKRRDWDGTPCVELLSGGADGSAAARRSIEAATIAARIAALVSGRDSVRVYDAGKGQRAKGKGDYDENLEPRSSSLEPVFEPRLPRYGDIAILFRRFTHLKVFEQELRRSGIPYYVVKGRGFYRCQEVLDILNFLTWLESPGNLAPLAGVLRSPLCCISDETLYLLAKVEGGIGNWERLFHSSPFPIHSSNIFDRLDPGDRDRLASLAGLVSRLRPLRDRLTLAELLEEILTGTDFASKLLTTFQGEQKVANLRKLIEISRTFSAVDGGSLRRFVNYLADLVEKEPTEAEALISAEGENVVRLMTIHQSKGLEFPVVFVPELGMPAPAGGAAVAFDEDMGMGVKMALPGAAGRSTLAWREISALRRSKEAAEQKRLLYVAMTRARDYLVLSGEGKGEWRAWLDDFLTGEDAVLVNIMDSQNCPLPPAGGGVGWGGSQAVPDIAVKEEVNPGAVAAAFSRSLQYAPPPSEMVFSPTALEDYRGCPRKYFYKAVLGLDEGLFAEIFGAGQLPHGRKGKTEEMSPLAKGDLAHQLLERLDFAASPDHQRASCQRLAPVLADDPSDRGVAEVIGAVTSFAASPLARELGAARLYREYPFFLRLEAAVGYYVRGAMDLVAITEKEAAVYDYKYLARGDADLDGYRFQIRTYMLALARAFPAKRISGALIFLRGGEIEPVTCEFAAFERELVEIAAAVRQRSGETDFALRQGCDGTHCPFRGRCKNQAQGTGHKV